MAKEQLVMRMLCSEAKVDSNKVRKGFINKRDDWNKLTNAPANSPNHSSLSMIHPACRYWRCGQRHGASNSSMA